MKRLIVLGCGPGGNAAALAAARHGCKEVVLVEKDAMGGTCTNRGCIPTKFLLSRLERNPPAPDRRDAEWGRLMAHKKSLLRGLSASIEKSCLAAGVEVVKGQGRLAGPDTVVVTGQGPGERKIAGDGIIIATGSVPAMPPAFEMDGHRVMTSTEALDLERPPASIAIIGSGAVGSEFAFIFQRAGARVTVIEGEKRLFPGEDENVHQVFAGLFEKMGIAYRTGSPVTSAVPGGSGATVRLASGEAIEVDKVLVGVGRRLLTSGLGLGEVGVERGDRGEIIVDDRLMTTREGIMAVGDVTGRLLLAHLASRQGVHAARTFLGRPSRGVPYDAVPWSIFTTPEIATVGLNEELAGRRGVRLISAAVPWMDNIKARIDRATEGFVKINADADTGKIIGGTIVGVHAADTIHIVSSFIHSGATVGDAAGMVFAHPGLAETISDVLQKLQHLLRSSGE